MKRIKVALPDNLAARVERERRRRGVSTAQIVREALAAHFNVSPAPRRLRIIGLGGSGIPDLAENDERYLDEEWGSEEFFNRTMGRYRDADTREAAAPDRQPSADVAEPANEPFVDNSGGDDRGTNR